MSPVVGTQKKRGPPRTNTGGWYLSPFEQKEKMGKNCGCVRDCDVVGGCPFSFCVPLYPGE